MMLQFADLVGEVWPAEGDRIHDKEATMRRYRFRLHYPVLCGVLRGLRRSEFLKSA